MVEKTLFVLLYLVPQEAKEFSLKASDGQTEKLPLKGRLEVPEGLCAALVEYKGDVSFGTPILEKEGWGLPSEKR
jgi:hypothetical protein